MEPAPIPSVWRKHLRDPDVWHTGLVAMGALTLTLGIGWGVFLLRTVRTARRASSRSDSRRPVLLFGKRLIAGGPDRDLLDRIERLRALADSNHVDVAFLLGGAVKSGVSEASVAADLLRARGWPQTLTLVLEEQSGNTLENLRHAKGMLPSGMQGPVTLISNRYHLERCAVLANSVGIAHVLCAAEEQWQWQWRSGLLMLRESLLSFWLVAGVCWARWLGHKRMLSRLGE